MNFTCARCEKPFTVAEATLAKYPGWKPRLCLTCRDETRVAETGTRPSPVPGATHATRRPGRTGELSTQEVLAKHHLGPDTGLFTDGSAMPNPGPGGWGVVWVEDGVVVKEAHGRAPDTTNNRMELTALIEAFRMLPADAKATVYSDSELCVRTVNEWAPRWEKAGWKRRSGAIMNLDLVKELHSLARARPKVKLAWVPAHSGWRWNEYADALAGDRTT